MPLLRTSLQILLLTAGLALHAGVPVPAFSSDGGSAPGGQSIVKIVGSKTVPKLANGVDVGKDQILPVNFSGYSGTWDIATADAVFKLIEVRVQSQDTSVSKSSYHLVDVYTTGTPSDLAVADVSNKTTHTDDLIVAEDGSIHIYKNTRDTATPGLPAFADSLTLTATATDSTPLHINKIAIADVNQDGQPDIVGVGTIVVNGVNQVQVAVFLSNAISPGVPSFQNATVYTTNARATGDLVAVGNLIPNSLYPDIVVAGSNGDTPANGSSNGSGYGEFIVFYNKGNSTGTFGNGGDAVSPPFVQQLSHHLHALAVGDVNSDGHRDVVVESSNFYNGQTVVNVFGGNDAGQPGGVNNTGETGTKFLGTNTSRTFQGGLAIGDLNGDGIPDIASVLDTDGLYVIAIPAVPESGNNFPGADSFFFHASAGPNACAVAITDLNRNGAFDLVVANKDTNPNPKSFVQFFNTKASTPTITPPGKPTFPPGNFHYGQQVAISSSYSTTVANAHVSFQKKGSDGKWVALGSVTGVNGVFTVKTTKLTTDVYTFRASVTVGGKIAYSDESDPLTIGLAAPTITGFTPAVGTRPAKLTITEGGIPAFAAGDLTFTLQSSPDGITFTDVTGVTITGAAGKYTVSASSIPSDVPYFRVVASLDGATITSPNFTLYLIDAAIAQVTNDSTATDDATQVVKTGPALGFNVINTTGVGQTKTVRLPGGGSQTFGIKFTNRSKFPESLLVTGLDGNTNFDVRYFASTPGTQGLLIGSDITSMVTGNGYAGTLPAGESGVIYVRARTYPGTPRATVLNLPVSVTVVGDPSRRDVVQLTVSATDAPRAVFVTSGASTGPGTLFEAITYANAHPGTTIEFEVPSDDAHWITYNFKPLLKIFCTTPLPMITAAGTVIDGTSQRELPDQDYSATNPAICLVGYGIPDNSINQDQPGEIGLDFQAANCAVKALMVTRFAVGARFSGAKAVNGSVFGCTFLGNTDTGLRVENHAAKITIGGPSAGERNVFRALQENNNFYGNYGVAISGHCSGNKVQGNFIGTTETGAPEPNLSYGFLQSGVFIERSSEGNLVGGTSQNTGNLISGNTGSPTVFSAGIEIRSSSNLVQGNFIGTTLDGNTKNGNAIGVLISVGLDDQNKAKVTDGNIIGSTELGGTNLISGNQIGIKSTSGVEHTRIYGNYIGTNINGLSAVPNTIGIRLHGYDSTIGGKTAAYRNVISGNTDDGILLDFDRNVDGHGNPAARGTYNEVYGNYIGVNSINSGALPNGGNGVETFSGGNTVGDSGPGLANIIANNTKAGVLLNGPSNLQNTVRANSMFNNGTFGIDVVPENYPSESDGVTANDDNAHDADGLQNFPELYKVDDNSDPNHPKSGPKKVANNTYKVSGELHTLPNQSYVIDAYLTDLPYPARFGQGKVYLGSIKLKTDASGDLVFALTLPIPAAGQPGTGRGVCMTATQLITQNGATFFGGTSEFSQNAVLP